MRLCHFFYNIFFSMYIKMYKTLFLGAITSLKCFNIFLMCSMQMCCIMYTILYGCLTVSEHHSMSQTVFRQTWKKLLPFIVTARPMTDLCWTCQKNNNLIYRSANLSESDKSERLIQQEQHLMIVQQERSLYNEMVRSAKGHLPPAGSR